jgi:hypothetical protein
VGVVDLSPRCFVGAELLTGTFYLLAVGVAVAFGGVAAFAGAALPVQFTVAGVLGIALTIIAHRLRLAKATPPPQPSLDIGKTVRVETGTPTAPRGSTTVAPRGTPSSPHPMCRAPRRCTSSPPAVRASSFPTAAPSD